MPTTPTLLSRILIIAILVLASANPTPAQSSPISVRITAGTVFLSLRDWERFFTDIADHEYQHHVPDPYVGASVHQALSDRHAISVGTERIRTSASLFGYMVIINQTGDSLGILAVDIVNWTFQGIPITLGYEYRRPLWNGRIIPFAGAGLSYFMSQVQADITYMAQAMPMPEADSSPRKGEGYGLHTLLGLVTHITNRMHLVSQVRYRFADGMAFTDKEGSIKIEFTGFDASLGLEWSF